MVSCEGCNKEGAPMQCPTCKANGLAPSFFCTQDCFKKSWATHKAKHSQPPGCTINTMTEMERATFNFPGTLRPFKISPRRSVPSHIPRPDYAEKPDGRSPSEEADRGHRAKPMTGAELAKMKKACQLCREVLDIGCAAVKPGVTTDEIDRIVHEATVARNMYPSPLNYYNFPKSVCTSINEIICHGIPDARPLEEGDIVNIDVSGYFEGMHGDLNEMVFVGKPDADSLRLVHCTYECLMAAIATVKPGALYKHCGDAIEARARASECSVVRTYSGHGVGDKFHTSPTIAHYADNKSPGIMAVGHVFTIEPMINLGTWQDVTWPDNWTSTTKDGMRSAQFEHTMVVTEKGVELLTPWKENIPFYQRQLKEWGIALPVTAGYDASTTTATAEEE